MVWGNSVLVDPQTPGLGDPQSGFPGLGTPSLSALGLGTPGLGNPGLGTSAKALAILTNLKSYLRENFQRLYDGNT